MSLFISVAEEIMILLALVGMLAWLASFVFLGWGLMNAFAHAVTASVLLARRGIGFVSDVPRRLRWSLLHVWNVLCLRRWWVFTSVAAITLATVIPGLILRPIYSATCVIKMEREQGSMY
jgi:hypothetical protein